MNVIPALAAAMAALLLGVRPAPDPSDDGRDDCDLWLVAAALAVLVR